MGWRFFYLSLKGEESLTNVKAGSDLFIEALLEENVQTVFGYPGGSVLPIYDAMYKYDTAFKHILCRHEQGCIHAAEGYARVTGKAGVVIATSGPGATNIITGLADAMMDSLPIVAFTGQVGTPVIGSDAFQEADIISVTSPITKHNFQVRDAREMKPIIQAAFKIATTGRPGPVVVDIPKNVQEQIVDETLNTPLLFPGFQPNKNYSNKNLKKIINSLHKSKRPVLLVGAGIQVSEASKHLREFVNKTNIPVVSTIHGLGSIESDYKNFLGMAGMHGTYTANMAIRECDFLLNIGSRFDDRLTGKPDEFAPNAVIAHIDIDESELGKNIETDIPVNQDANEFLKTLIKENLKETDTKWLKKLSRRKESYPLWYNTGEHLISPQWLIEEISKFTNGEALVTTDVGQHQMWTAQFYQFNQPRQIITSGGLGTMGFGLPSSIGVQIAKPNQTVVSINGDGGFQMCIQELATIREYNLPIKIFIVNNEALGMVRQWQEEFYDERYSHSLMMNNPDFITLAEGFGIKALRVSEEDKVQEVMEAAFSHNGPVVIDARVQKLDLVYPMVPAGKGNHEMIGVKPCDISYS